jgi:hypothetical protein
VVFNSKRFGTLCLFHLHRQVDIMLQRQVQTGLVRVERGLFAGSSPVVDTNDWCGGLGVSVLSRD